MEQDGKSPEKLPHRLFTPSGEKEVSVGDVVNILQNQSCHNSRFMDLAVPEPVFNAARRALYGCSLDTVLPWLQGATAHTAVVPRTTEDSAARPFFDTEALEKDITDIE
eukprot:gb/GECG01000495.1/.p1 GENE.gb/GECG01000495.1/~~gb/GECG01000495.1/.p1  ORF type:complete len:109 (+),score=11.42 gb/GECG01000495.1/:1-327(+)